MPAKQETKRKDVKLLVSGVKPRVPDDLIARTVLTALDNRCTGVTVVSDEEEGLDAEPVPRGSPDRPRK